MWFVGGGVRGEKTIGTSDEIGLHAVEDRLQEAVRVMVQRVIPELFAKQNSQQNNSWEPTNRSWTSKAREDFSRFGTTIGG